MKKKILRNLAVIGVVALICVVLVLVAMFGNVVLSWFKAIGWTYAVTIAVTALVCAIIFPIGDWWTERKSAAADKTKKYGL